MYAAYVASTAKPKRVYVQVVDAANRKRSRSLTVYGVTPTEAMRLIARALNATAEQKAG